MNTLTREQRKAELEAMKAPELNEVMNTLNIGIKVGQTNDAKIEAILQVTHGGDQNPPNQQQTPPDAPSAQGGEPSNPSDTTPPPPAEPTPPQEPEQDPLDAEVAKIDLVLEKLRAQLIEQVQAAAKNGVIGESAEAIRAGAVDFLKAANQVLKEARELNESTRGVAAQLSAQRQGIAKASEDLNRRSEAYKTMAAQNNQERQAIRKAQEELAAATRRV